MIGFFAWRKWRRAFCRNVFLWKGDRGLSADWWMDSEEQCGDGSCRKSWTKNHQSFNPLMRTGFVLSLQRKGYATLSIEENQWLRQHYEDFLCSCCTQPDQIVAAMESALLDAKKTMFTFEDFGRRQGEGPSFCKDSIKLWDDAPVLATRRFVNWCDACSKWVCLTRKHLTKLLRNLVEENCRRILLRCSVYLRLKTLWKKVNKWKSVRDTKPHPTSLAFWG